MRAHVLGPIAVCLIGGMLYGRTIEQRLAWARSAIDMHAEMHFSDPPGLTSRTQWQVTRVEGCEIGLKQTWQKSAHAGDNQPVAEKVTTYAFNLRDLQPDYVMADSSTGLPQVTIFAAGDVFHTTSNFTQAPPGIDGGEKKSWSVTGNSRNLWIYFDSSTADNLAMVKRVRDDLRVAIRECRASPHHRW